MACEAHAGMIRSRRRPLVEKEGRLLAAVFELALWSALHRPRARRRVRICLDVKFECRGAVRRQAGRRARKHVGVTAGRRGELGAVDIVHRQR